jgi:uncharacterized membrane protein
MTRRRSLPWIYRWSRPLLGAIAIVGACLTGYLTYVKFTGGEVACSTGGVARALETITGCDKVLSSPYATVFGLPLSLFGLLAYLSMAGFALFPLFVNQEVSKSFRSNLENWTWRLLLAGGAAMAVFSGYLMYILATDLKTVCPYCITSAVLSSSLFIITVIGREWEELGQIFFTAIIVGMITLVGTLGVYANIKGPSPSASGLIPIPEASTEPKPPSGWEITTTSGPAEIALAKHLTAVGAKMYGAFWCPHCYEQKQLFGKEAFQEVTYIECAPQGKNPQPEACQAAGIQAFPTWEIKGKLYSGAQLSDKLAKESGYQGATNFKYTLPGR